MPDEREFEAGVTKRLSAGTATSHFDGRLFCTRNIKSAKVSNPSRRLPSVSTGQYSTTFIVSVGSIESIRQIHCILGLGLKPGSSRTTLLVVRQLQRQCRIPQRLEWHRSPRQPHLAQASHSHTPPLPSQERPLHLMPLVLRTIFPLPRLPSM